MYKVKTAGCVQCLPTKEQGGDRYVATMVRKSDRLFALGEVSVNGQPRVMAIVARTKETILIKKERLIHA